MVRELNREVLRSLLVTAANDGASSLPRDEIHLYAEAANGVLAYLGVGFKPFHFRGRWGSYFEE